MARRDDMMRALPRLIASLVACVVVAGLVSAVVLGLIPATHRAALRFACPAGTPCSELKTVLVLAAPGVALALATIVGTFAFAFIRAKRRAA